MKDFKLNQVSGCATIIKGGSFPIEKNRWP